MLSVQLLGSPQISRDGLPLTVTRRKSRALLYYLAAHPQPVTRERLLDLLWSDLDRAAAQQVLRTTLHGLRKTLADALVVADDGLSLAPDAEVDARHLARLSVQADLPTLAATAELYQGAFLDGFELLDGRFDDWVQAEREHYRQLATRALVALARQHSARADHHAALAAVTRALTLDPLQEDVQRDAMRLHYLAGDRVGAIRRYERLRELLDEELGVPPMAETRALYDAIITDTLPADHRPMTKTIRGQNSELKTQNSKLKTQNSKLKTQNVVTLPFTGRADELHRLQTQTLPGKLALIEGDPGIGKTRMAEEFLGTGDALVLLGVAHDLEHALPYQPVIEALRGLIARPDWPTIRATLALPPVWLAEVARLLPELDGGTPRAEERPIIGARPATDEARLWEGINQLLCAVARERPVALLLDDLQWADATTLALLGYLLRHADAPLTFVATTRPVAPRSPLAALLQTLTREGRLVRVQLERLSAADVRALALHISPHESALLARWLAQAEGNPYILAELIRHAHEHGLLRADGTLSHVVLAAAQVMPQTVYSLIQSRLTQLSESARRVLDAAVAVGREFGFEIVVQASALSEGAVLDALDELGLAALIRPLEGLRYRFDHNLTLEVAEREVGAARHQLLHRRVAEALISVYGSHTDEVAGLIASHYAEGGASGCAAVFAFRAGQRAARLAAWQEAIAFYEQALGGASEQQRAEILMALGDVYFYSGEGARAAETFRAVLATTRADSALHNEARLALGRAMLTQGRFAEIITLVQQVLASGRAEHAAAAEFLWGTALSLEGADLNEAAVHVQRATQMLHSQPSRYATLMQTHFELGSIAAQQGDLPRAIISYRAALAALPQQQGEIPLPWHILTLNNLAYHLHLLGDPTAAEYAREGLRLAQEQGALLLQTFLRSTLGEIALAAGDLVEAERSFAEGLALAERLHAPERIAGLTANMGLVALRRDQRDLAIHRLSTALAQADALGTRHMSTQIRIWIAPLLPPAERRATLAEARATAEAGGRKQLLAEIARLEQSTAAGGDETMRR